MPATVSLRCSQVQRAHRRAWPGAVGDLRFWGFVGGDVPRVFAQYEGAPRAVTLAPATPSWVPGDPGPPAASGWEHTEAPAWGHTSQEWPQEPLLQSLSCWAGLQSAPFDPSQLTPQNSAAKGQGREREPGKTQLHPQDGRSRGGETIERSVSPVMRPRGFSSTCPPHRQIF